MLAVLLWTCGVAPAHAGIILSTPAGLSPGDQFRIVFVTDGTTSATSADISTYDAFVNAEVSSLGGVTYNGQSVTGWEAIGSTGTVNASDHINQGVSGPANIPVFLVNGTEIAAGTTTAAGGLWSDSIMHSLNLTLDQQIISSLVWTGTDPNGTADSAFPLGSTAGGGIVGSTTQTDSHWVFSGAAEPSRPLPLFGISGVLTVAVPEPSSYISAGIGVIGVIVCDWWRRRRTHQPG